MDILNLIKEKLQRVSSEDKPKGINAILSHIEIAEHYLKRGVSDRDENYFTDVVYRTNHAFEGILKEAYEVLNKKVDSKTTPYEIETYLLEQSVFNDRVMHLFTNYRTNWRNPSTHDYQLFFSEQEAFLAIVTVSSLVNVLLDQIVEKLSYISSKKQVREFLNNYKSKVKDYKSMSLIEKCIEIFRSYSEYMQQNFELVSKLPEAEIIGSITGFISEFEPKWNIITNQSIDIDSHKLYIDILLEFNNEKIIVEVKRNVEVHNIFYNNLGATSEQLSILMKKSGIQLGLAYHTPTGKNHEIFSSLSQGNEGITIGEIFSISKSNLPEDIDPDQYTYEVEELTDEEFEHYINTSSKDKKN